MVFGAGGQVDTHSIKTASNSGHQVVALNP
jgi:uncharacterized protein YbjT (DUF2867 family)